MNTYDFETAILALVEHDRRYRSEAYVFVLAALERARCRHAQEGHLSGPELLDGVRELGLARFGPLAPLVFRRWGVESTADFGEIVHNLARVEILSTRPEDTVQSFAAAFDFHDVFVRGYDP